MSPLHADGAIRWNFPNDITHAAVYVREYRNVETSVILTRVRSVHDRRDALHVYVRSGGVDFTDILQTQTILKTGLN